MDSSYEFLETYTLNNELWSYLRHKKTGLEIAFHKCDTEETGFSFCFKTPVEDQYLGTSHVLEHCVLSGSKKNGVSFLDLLKLSCYSEFNAETDFFDTRYYFYSPIEEECIKLIPILADYVFFPELSEEAFMQECIRVELDEKGDGRKKKLAGVVYNEMKDKTAGTICGGIPYKLNELTNQKIKEYHKKYYRPDNCLFIFNGNASLEIIIQAIDKVVSELEENFCESNIIPRKNFTVQEFIEKVPFKTVPENAENSAPASWLIDEKDDACAQIQGYWTDGLSPIMPFVLDKKYAYSAYCWYNDNFSEINEDSVPPKKTIPQIISEYLGKYSSEEYKEKLEKLRVWQTRDVREQMLNIMKPLVAAEYDVEIGESEEELKELFDRYKDDILKYSQKYKEVEIDFNENSFCTAFRPSSPLTKEFYAEYSLCIYLEKFLFTKLRQIGQLYGIQTRYNFPFQFQIYTYCNSKSQQTFKLMKKFIIELANYNFTQTDLLIIKSSIYSLLFSKNTGRLYFSNKIFDILPEDLHQAAVRFKNMIYSIS